MKAPSYDWQWAPLQIFSSHLYHAVNLQLCLPSLALCSQLELMEPSPSFSEGIAFDSVDHPHSKEASHYLFFSWPEQKRIYTCKVPWNKMTELLWWRVKIQPVIELPWRSTNLQWTCQPKMQPVFVCHCQLACKRSTDLSDEDYDAAPWRLIAATRTMHILYNVLPMKSSFDANCWAVERCGMIVAMHRSLEIIQEEKPEYKPNTCRFWLSCLQTFSSAGHGLTPEGCRNRNLMTVTATPHGICSWIQTRGQASWAKVSQWPWKTNQIGTLIKIKIWYVAMVKVG